MLIVSEDRQFLISLPENVREKEVTNISIASICGKMPSQEALIKTMQSCFRRNFTEIVFFINYEGSTFVIDGNVNTSYAEYLKELKKFIK